MAIKLIPPDPDGMNDERAGRAGHIIRLFIELAGTGEPLRDLLCDLAHWADRNDKDFETELRAALSNYKAETEAP